MFKKVWKYIKESNHWKHMIGGAIVAIPFSVLSGLYCSFIAGASLEFKDRQHGGKFDFNDLLCTVIGGSITTIIKLFV